MLKGFEKLMDADFSTISESEFNEIKKSFHLTIESWKLELQKLADGINRLLPEIRENIKSSTGKKNHRAINSLPIFCDLINSFVREYTEGEIELNINTYPWNEIELFAMVWDNYFKELEVSPTRKFHANDWFDLFNLVYVSPGYKYWTDETKWVELIKNNQNTSVYLFE